MAKKGEMEEASQSKKYFNFFSSSSCRFFYDLNFFLAGSPLDFVTATGVAPPPDMMRRLCPGWLCLWAAVAPPGADDDVT